MMLKHCIAFAFFLLFLKCPAQTTFVHPSSFGVSYSVTDFKNKAVFGNLKKMDAGVSIHYIKGINNNLDLQFCVNGAFPDSISKSSMNTGKKQFLLQADLGLRIRPSETRRQVQPYLVTGAGSAFVSSKIHPYIIIGPGVQFKFHDLYLLTNAQYRKPVTNQLNNHLYYSIGLAGQLSKGKIKKRIVNPITVVAVPLAKDSDGDGLLDSIDACPLQPGIIKFNGCPDTDNDGIQDKEDHCPLIFGYSRYYGCVVPDTDKDGINDEEDSCINVLGLIQNSGCPAITANKIRSLEKAASNIYFETGSSVLLSQSFAALDTVINILNEYPLYNLIIEGHTDNVGAKEANQILSERRAKAVYDYLAKSIAVERLANKGFGFTMPVADNNTVDGRAKNRRVVLKMAIKE